MTVTPKGYEIPAAAVVAVTSRPSECGAWVETTVHVREPLAPEASPRPGNGPCRPQEARIPARTPDPTSKPEEPATAALCDLVRCVEDACFGAAFVSRATLRAHRCARPWSDYSTLAPFADVPDALIDQGIATGWLEVHLRKGSAYVGLSEKAKKWRAAV